MGRIKNISRTPLNLEDGRTIRPGGEASRVDLEDSHLVAALERDQVLVLDDEAVDELADDTAEPAADAEQTGDVAGHETSPAAPAPARRRRSTTKNQETT